MQGNKAGQMRLQREGKAAVKDIEKQLKKNGKIEDGFICLPDPEDVFTWYYIIFNLDYKQYNGGFFMGKIICPPEYPAKPPKVIVETENGRFHTWSNGICLSISDYHPESWNPVWKVNQVVIGLTSFWQTSDDTYGGVYPSELQGMCKNGETKEQLLRRYAFNSRDKVLKHHKFGIFEKYAEAIGINKVPEIFAEEIKQKEEKEKLELKRQQEEEEKRIEEERIAKEAEQAKLDEENRIEEERIKKEEEQAKLDEEQATKVEEEQAKVEDEQPIQNIQPMVDEEQAKLDEQEKLKAAEVNANVGLNEEQQADIKEGPMAA